MEREFYLIAHGCNDKAKVRRAFKQKVNGIECDLWCDDEKKWWVSHDGLFKTDLKKWLTFISKAEEKYGQELAVILFDIKHAEPIKEVRETINSLLPSGLAHVYSVASLDMAHIFSEIAPLLSQHEALSIDEEDDPKKVAAFFNKLEAKQCWYGNGISLFLINDQYHDSMQEAGSIRDTSGPFSKVYTWSIHTEDPMRKYILEDKVDGMLVGLNSLLTRPVNKALKILKNHDIKMANRNSRLFDCPAIPQD